MSGDHPCVVIERTARVKRKGSGRMAKGDRVRVSAHLKNVVKIEKLVVLTEKKNIIFKSYMVFTKQMVLTKKKVVPI